MKWWNFWQLDHELIQNLANKIVDVFLEINDVDRILQGLDLWDHEIMRNLSNHLQTAMFFWGFNFFEGVGRWQSEFGTRFVWPRSLGMNVMRFFLSCGSKIQHLHVGWFFAARVREYKFLWITPTVGLIAPARFLQNWRIPSLWPVSRLANKHNYRKSPCSMGTLTINGHFQ